MFADVGMNVPVTAKVVTSVWHRQGVMGLAWDESQKSETMISKVIRTVIEDRVIRNSEWGSD